MSSFKKIGKLLPNLPGSSDFNRAVQATGIVEDSQKVLDGKLGEDAPFVKVISYRQGVLTVKCSRSIFAETVRLREQELREAINAEFGREAIDKIILK